MAVSLRGEDLPTLVPAADSEVRIRSGVMLTLERARELHARGAHEEALDIALQLLASHPSDADAVLLAASCQDALEQRLLTALGSTLATLRTRVSADALKTYEIDSVSAFLHSLIDGRSTVGDLLDVSGLAPLEVLTRLHHLVELGVIALA